MPMTQHWQQQLLRAESSRVASSPHHRARTAAMTSRMTHKPAAVAILNPNDNNRPASAQGIGSPAPGTPNGHRKNVLSVASNAPSAAPSPPVNGGKDHDTSADPMNPAQPPAPASKPDDASYEPWTGLDLGGIHLKTLSPSLFTFVHITSLYINHNNLKVLPPAISNLRNLTLLDATSNELTALPPEIGMLSKLKELLLFDNQLDSLPTEIGGLYQLEVLGIEGNPMDEFVRKTVAENGVPALIAHYRDMHQSDSPPERAWIEVEPDLELDGGSTESFSTLSYHILCPAVAPS
jgi:CCR4-NOT transcription complex subunit 6